MAPVLGRIATAGLPWLLCVGFTVAVYGSSLHAGIMFDAALDLPRATERSWLEVLTNAGPSPYFRPITLLLWKACYELLGRNDFVVLHGLSLACHAACGWLVYQLGRRLLGVPAGGAAAALFLWFPLSYQVVAFVDSLFHSLAALWVLATAVLYWDFRHHGSRWRLPAALACAALALLTHEGAAALLTPAIVALELLTPRRRSVALEATREMSNAAWAIHQPDSAPLITEAPRSADGTVLSVATSRPDQGTSSVRPVSTGVHVVGRRAPRFAGRRLWPAAFAAETLAFFLVWLAVPRWPSTPKLDLPSVRLNAVYFLQGLGYPLTELLGRLPRLPLGSAGEALTVSLLVAAVLSALAALRGRAPAQALSRAHAVERPPREGELERGAAAMFGLLWFAAAVAVPCLLLPWPNYVIDAPRLLYTASAGIALLWAAAFAPRRLSLSALPGVCVLALILAQSYGFLAVRERLLDQGAALVSQIMETAARPGEQAGRTFVNVPAFLGPKDDDFLLGHSGVTMLPDYFGLDLEVAAATGQHLPITSVAVDDLARSWEAAYGFQGQHSTAQALTQAINSGGGVYVNRFEPGSLRLEYVGGVSPGEGASVQPLARFGDWAAVEQASAKRVGDTLEVHLVWRALKPAPGDYTALVHVVGEGPEPLVQADGYPIAGLLPPKDWPPGASIDDERRIPLPADARGKPLRVLIGLYDRASPTTRAKTTDGAGTPAPDDVLAIQVEG